MKRVELITYKNKQIMLIDFSHLKPEEIIPVMTEAKKVLGKQAEGSILTMTDLTHTPVDPEVAAAMKDYAVHNKPYVKAAAVVGAIGLTGVIKNRVEKSAMRDLVNFATREQAQEWLIGQ